MNNENIFWNCDWFFHPLKLILSLLENISNVIDMKHSIDHIQMSRYFYDICIQVNIEAVNRLNFYSHHFFFQFVSFNIFSRHKQQKRFLLTCSKTLTLFLNVFWLLQQLEQPYLCQNTFVRIDSIVH